MQKELGLKAYKVEKTQELHSLAYVKRRIFVNLITKQLADFFQKITFSGETQFEISGKNVLFEARKIHK